ncbi:hypothetical protein [Saccharibacillus sp. JS10]|uniref:hypothetical protein n=1 Tax=Saccharibacillus sp. JS10 TaxID=2950552 RepID=UPI00210C9A9D|nr:hypothetical protein [Saccharibacillus sp. JS10]MCQ4087444.1 hypothetical protein [Saccharibacillus sp. JS10]
MNDAKSSGTYTGEKWAEHLMLARMQMLERLFLEMNNQRLRSSQRSTDQSNVKGG